MSCSPRNGEGSRSVTVTLPAIEYFAKRLLPDSVAVNVMIPKGADHDSYTPRPSQMADLAASDIYLAIGPMAFERTWRQRFDDVAPDVEWVDLSEGIGLIGGHECHEHAHAGCSHSADGQDPHYWLSPKRATTLARNISKALKSHFPNLMLYVDSASSALMADIAAYDAKLSALADSVPGKAFVIFHPALSYIEADYGFRQLAAGAEGLSLRPQSYAAMADSARKSGAKVFFVQQGYAPERVELTAKEIGAEVVPLQPEGEDWDGTMQCIIQALSK